MKRSAFSLIELSIVILIIGILIAGVTQSSRLIKQFRIQTGRTLTQSSPVASIKDLAIWYETSLESSIIAAEAEDTLPVTNWFDNNVQGITKNNAAGSSTTRPTYRENVINGLPALRFDGTDDFMTFDGTILVNSNYTIFVAEQRRDNGDESYFFGGTGMNTDSNLHIGYRSSTVLTQAHYTDDMDYTISAFTAPIPTIHTFMFSTTAGKKYWMNGGGTTADSASSSQTTALNSYPGASIGRFNPTPNYYNGDIAEIIVFTRALKTEERQAIENYLSKKYGIKIS